MTEQNLRRILTEAQKQKQQGLLIWANESVWDDCSFDLKPGDINYDAAMAAISNKKEMMIQREWNGLLMSGLVAVSVEKLCSSCRFFDKVLEFCNKNHFNGPITLVPLNKVMF